MSSPDNGSPSVDLSVIEKSIPPTLSQHPDEKTQDEENELERKRQEIVIRGAEQDIEERKKYAHRNFCLIVGWLVVVNLMLFFQGFKFTVSGHEFSLPTPVLLTVIGSTTATILGIFVIVTKYLFPNR